MTSHKNTRDEFVVSNKQWTLFNISNSNWPETVEVLDEEIVCDHHSQCSNVQSFVFACH